MKALAEQCFPTDAVIAVKENVLLGVSSEDDVIESPRKVDSGFARHNSFLERPNGMISLRNEAVRPQADFLGKHA